MSRPPWPILAIFAVALAGVLWLTAERGNKSSAPRLVSVIQLTSVDGATFEGFRESLTAYGYREGREIEYLHDGPAGSIDALEPMILRHLARHPDLILVSSTPATLAVKRILGERRIPVVFAPVNDPVASGIVAGLKNPGGMITGVRLPAGDDLRLVWLKKVAPGVRQVFLPYNPADRSALTSLELARRAADGLGIQIIARETRDAGEVRQALAAFPSNADAIYLPRDSTVESLIDDFVVFSHAHRRPLSAPSLAQTRAGALFSYGFVHRQIGNQAARLADQILRGIPPSDLPVETAENQFALNLGAAAAIGLTIPAHLVMQADEVIRP